MNTRVYARYGRVAHLLKWSGSPNNSWDATLCGWSAWPHDWLGTGDQNEHERAAELPLCKRCQGRSKL